MSEKRAEIMRSFRFNPVLAAAILASFAAGVSAQTVSVTPANTRPSAGWTVTPMFSFSQSSDSNVTLSPQGTPDTGDSVAGLTPSGEVGYLGRLTAFTAGYAGAVTRYWNFDQLNSFDQRLYASFRRQVSPRVQVFAQNSAGWMPTTDSVLLAGIPFMRVGSTVETLEGGARFGVAKFTSVGAGYRFEWVDFDRSNPLAAQLFGGHSHGFYGDVKQQVATHVSVGGAIDYRRANVAGGLQQFDLMSAEGTVDYQPSRDLTLSGGFGFSRIAGPVVGVAATTSPVTEDPLAGPVTTLDGTRTGPSWRAGANYRLDRALAFITYRRSYVPTFAIGGTVQNEEFSGGITVPIAFRQRLVVGGSLAWRRNEPLTTDQLTLKSLWIDTKGSYAVAPWLRVEGFYSYSTQDSHVGGIRRDRVGISLVALAPMRFK